MTKVVFRVWDTADNGGVFALFPEMDWDEAGRFCSSYDATGGHSGADYANCIDLSRAASEGEYAPLRQTLERIGYELEVIGDPYDG